MIVFVLQIKCFRWLKPIKISPLKFVKTCVYEDDYESYENEYHRKKIDENMKVLMDLSDEPIYTLIWYDCPECKQLLDIMKQENKKSVYIRGNYYFYDTYENTKTNKPLFYREDEFISDVLFDIYAENMGL